MVEKKRSALPSSASNASGSSKRRKQDGVQKFYAVKAGKKPGIYMHWPDAHEQTKGFPGALCEGFESRQDAEAFLAGREVKSKKGQPTKFYAVAAGKKTGIFTSWSDVQPLVTGIKGPKQKKFSSEAEAVAYILEHGDARAIQALREDGYEDRQDEDEGSEAQPDSDEAEDQVQAEQLKVQAQPSRSGQKKKQVIYTDGSSRGNGKEGARAGYGVYFGKNDPRNVAERLQGDLQTNQRAELMAIKHALDVAVVNEDADIYTDSQYSINCVKTWARNWAKNGWKNQNGQDVSHKEIIQAILAKIDERARAGAKTQIEWVKGHATSEGNIAADELANRGAAKG